MVSWGRLISITHMEVQRTGSFDLKHQVVPSTVYNPRAERKHRLPLVQSPQDCLVADGAEAAMLCQVGLRISYRCVRDKRLRATCGRSQTFEVKLVRRSQILFMLHVCIQGETRGSSSILTSPIHILYQPWQVARQFQMWHAIPVLVHCFHTLSPQPSTQRLHGILQATGALYIFSWPMYNVPSHACGTRTPRP